MGLFGLQFEMSNGTSWEVLDNTAIPRPASAVIPATLAGTPNFGMMAAAADDFILTLSGEE